jgi:hypothetical protein
MGWPSLSQKTDDFFRMTSASRLWPIASWKKIPPYPAAMTTGNSPAGASSAGRFRTAMSEALRANRRSSFESEAASPGAAPGTA